MSEPKATLAERLARRRALGALRGTKSIRRAEPLTGDWPEGCQVFPASYAQSRLWFLHQLQPDLTAYHLPAFWQLKGEFNLNALSQALSGLIERHPTLRTSFQLHGSEVLQLLHPPAPLHLQAEPLGERDLSTVIQAWQQQEASTPFDFTSGQLLRARLLQVTTDEHLLLINHHHIASDGWSRSILSRDLTALYNAHRNGQPAQLQPLNVLYQDYAVWQRQRLSGDLLRKLHDYWIPQLTGLEPLELPTDHPRPATPSYQGESISFQIEPALLAPFEELCRSEGATLQMGLLALLALLLHRYSRQDDLAIGIPIWGRNHPDLEPLIGFFINTLPIRTRFSKDLSFRELLAQVKDTSIAAYDHQELPFEQMVEALSLERDTSRNPLVQVMLQLIELPPASLRNLDGLEVETLRSSSNASRFDLEFFLRRDKSGGINTTLVYATDLFCGDRIQRLSEHLLTLLASALQSPDAASASLLLLPHTERLLIESWQHGPSIEVPDLCVHQLFEQQVERTPDAIALIFEDQEISYDELNTRANHLAHHLIDLGVGPDVIVAVCLERSVELIVSLLGILKAGGAYLPLDQAWPQERIKKLFAAANAVLVISSKEISSFFSHFAPLVNIDGLNPGIGGNPAWREGNCRLDSLAYVLYTSGTTGEPKGVAVNHQTLANLVAWSNGDFRLGQTSKTLQFAASVFDVSLQEIFTTFCTGGCVFLVDVETRKDFSRLCNFAIKAELERIYLPYVALEQFAQFALNSSAVAALRLRDIISAGEKLVLTKPIADLIRLMPECRLHNHYGPTESHVVSSIQLDADPCAWRQESSIGTPISNSILVVLDADGHHCPIGVPGELHIGGDGLARGYLNNPELTTEKFIPDPFSADPSARLYKSGDLVSWNSDGTLAFHGRIDQQIKLRGFRIEPGEIEANLLAHPAVAQVTVILRHDDPANPRLIAYWVPEHAEVLSTGADQLRSFLAQRLPDYMVPSAFVALEALPLTTNGKLDRKALPAPSFAGDLTQRIEPSTDLERQLHAIWAEVLGHSEFGITDNFFAIGGHSLAAASLVSRAEKAIGILIPLANLFQKPTISGLVDQLEDEKGELEEDGLCCLIPLQPLGSRPPLFIVPGFGGGLVFEQGASLLAPHQPVYGLRVMGDPTSMGGDSFETIISAFADLIDDFWQQGDVNLMSYSIGGWYAHALAAELLRRGRTLGILVIIDTTPVNIKFSRSLGMMLLLDRLSQVRKRTLMRNLVHEPSLEKRWRFVLNKTRTLRQVIEKSIRLRISKPRLSLARVKPFGTRTQADFYVDLVCNSYRPRPLPVRVRLLATPLTAQRYTRLWRHYATRDLQVFRFLGEHLDVLRPDVQSKLALLIDNILIGQQDGI
jgi:amino acid adenylation domain-containing protein